MCEKRLWFEFDSLTYRQQSVMFRFDFDNRNRIESYTAIRFDFDFLNFVPSSIFFLTFSRLVITSILCTTVLFTLAIVFKYFVNCS
jgi:hypothetical protein